MPVSRILQAEAWRELPKEWPTDSRSAIRTTLEQLNQKVVVLDDDPTGTQTVHGIPVLTDWDVNRLAEEIVNPLPGFFILTNSRSLPLSAACQLNREIGMNLTDAARLANRRFVVISRGDSTLRGHFPGEVDALVEALGFKPDALLLIPFFAEGGRFTCGDVHYVAEGDFLVPAGETEFALDPVFGYRASNLREWVQEKSYGRISAKDVDSVTLPDIRLGGPDHITHRLQELKKNSICIVNCLTHRDLETFTLGLLKAELSGKRFIYRTAASFVSVRSSVEPKPLLSPEETTLGKNGGLIIIGSYIPRTTAQLQILLETRNVEGLELDVAPAILSANRREEEVCRIALQATQFIQMGRDVVVYTSRTLWQAQSDMENLRLGGMISAALVDVVRSIGVRPRYLIAKGGITSSDIATKALNVRRAMVLGQVLPGVPVWKTGKESRYPGLTYVVFPGNVGEPDSLAKVVQLWGKENQG